MEEASLELIARMKKESVDGHAPVIRHECKDGVLKLSCLGKYWQDAVKFFYEMVSRPLLPGRKIAVERFFSTLFKWKKQTYFVAEVVIPIENMQVHLPPLLREIELGLRSPYHAKRILEMKGLATDERIAMVQERITGLLRRFPKLFDYDIFHVMQKCLISTSEEYKKARSPYLISKIVSSIYVFTKQLLFLTEKAPHKRHLLIKVTRSYVDTPFGEKKVLGFFVGLNFLKENEVFDKRHLFKAAQKYFPSIVMNEESHFAHFLEEERLLVFYVEMEKEGITDKEVRVLERELENDLKGCIENLVRPIFMPRNEEEVLKYVVTLSNQITLVRDIPQIAIIFNEQVDCELHFTVVMVRPLLPDSLSIEELFAGKPEFSIEKVRHGGLIRKKFPKEAAVLKVHLSNTQFLRDDFAVDLYRARQQVVHELEFIFGEIRDYNGGMIAKQMEVFLSFQEMMQKSGEKNVHLLESFFHSLYPVELRSILHLTCLKTLYLLFQRVLFGEEGIVECKESRYIYVCLKIQNSENLETFNKLPLPTNQLVKLSLPLQDNFYLGFVFFSDSEEEQKMFLEMIREKLGMRYTLS